MAGIRSTIQLFDQFSAPFTNIINAVNSGMPVIQQLQQTMNRPVNMDSMYSVQAQIEEVTNAAQQLQEQMQGISSPFLTVDQPEMNVQGVNVPITSSVSGTPHVETPADITVPVIPAITEQPQIETPQDIAVPVTPVLTEEAQVNVPDNIQIPVVPVLGEQPQIEVPDEITIPVSSIVTNQIELDVPESTQAAIEITSNEPPQIDVPNEIQVPVVPVIGDQPTIDINAPEDITVPVVPVINTQPQIDVPQRLDVPVNPIVTEQPHIETPTDITVPVQTDVEQPTIDTSPVEIPVIPVVDEQPEVSPVTEDSGAYQAQIEQLASMMQQIVSIQQTISAQGEALTIMPDDVRGRIEGLNVSISRMGAALTQIQENPFNLDSETIRLQIVDLNNSILQTAQAQKELNTQMQGLTVPQLEQPPPVEIPVKWVTDHFEVFTSTGIERYQQELASLGTKLEEVSTLQSQIMQQTDGSQILPPQAITDIQNLQDRLNELQSMIQQVEANTLEINTDEANAQLERLRGQMLQVQTCQQNLEQAMQGTDVSAINNAYMSLSRTISSTEQSVRAVRDSMQKPVEIAVHWQSDSMEVFTNTGIERFQSEVQSTNNMLSILNQTQNCIAQTAASIDLFPSSMVADMNGMQTRLQAIQQRIQTIESNRFNIGADIANAELERLRQQLDQAVQEQENLNHAVQDMNIQAANDAYLRLSQTVGNTERYIRNNVDEQGRFNREIQEGTGNASQLSNMMKGTVAAYATMQTVTSVLNLSDQFTSTTARLNMMNDGLQTTKELQTMIYLSAERSRGAYQATADAVSKLGLMAGDAFSSSEEIIAFMEQVNKQFGIAGTEASGIEAAMLQLTQAMGSGILRGEEYNSILEQAPNIIQAIADYLEVPKGKLKDMAAEGQITADIVKAAMFAVADETNAKFNSMPKTFSQIWTSFQNTALIAFQSVLERLNELANSGVFESFVNNAICALSTVANVILDVFTLVEKVGGFIADHWSIIQPIILGVAAALAVYYGWQLAVNAIRTISKGLHLAMAAAQMIHAAATRSLTAAKAADIAAQNKLNTALYACPITWIIMLVIALVALLYVVVGAINEIAGTTISATGIMMGALATIGAFIVDIFILAWNIVSALIEFLMNVWKNPEFAIKAFAVNGAVAFLNLCLACVSGTQSAVSVIVGLWYGFLQAGHNIIATVYNFFAVGIEAIVNGWNSGVYQVKSYLISIATAALNVAQSVTSSMGSAASNMANMFVAGANKAISAVNWIIEALNKIPGVELGKVSEISSVHWDFGASVIADTASGLQSLLGEAPQTWKAPIMELGDIGDAYDTGKQVGADMVSGLETMLSGTIAHLQASVAEKPEDYLEAPKLDYINLSDAAAAGYEFGQSIDSPISEFGPDSLFDITDIPSPEDYANAMAGDMGNIGSGVDDIAGDTGSIADELSSTDEDLKYLRDIAEQEAINRFTTAEIHIEQNNNNNISSEMDLDGVVTYLTDTIGEAVQIAAEGVHI